MATNKDQLLQLIEFVQEISSQPGNEWFKGKLIETLIGNATPNNNIEKEVIAALSTNIESIHKYLLLDVVPIIDYSAVEDDIIRNQLYRDCLEMLKYRLGKINNHINFDEFCRYAHLQAEELINYFFYMKVDGDISQITKLISINKTKPEPPEHLSHIAYYTKLNAFAKLSKIDSKTKSTLIFINNLRNEMSHRNSLQIDNEDQILCDFEMNKLSGYVNFSSLSPAQTELYNKGKFIINKRLQDYDSIYDALRVLKDKVVALLIDQKLSKNAQVI